MDGTNLRFDYNCQILQTKGYLHRRLFGKHGNTDIRCLDRRSRAEYLDVVMAENILAVGRVGAFATVHDNPPQRLKERELPL